eukprot:454434-Prorocentrum_lima.AAC.1
MCIRDRDDEGTGESKARPEVTYDANLASDQKEIVHGGMDVCISETQALTLATSSPRMTAS